MKALSLRQPWAWAVVHAGKSIENRRWNTRGTVQGTCNDAPDLDVRLLVATITGVRRKLSPGLQDAIARELDALRDAK